MVNISAISKTLDNTVKLIISINKNENMKSKVQKTCIYFMEHTSLDKCQEAFTYE